MSLTVVYADPYTRAELGASGLVEVTRNLWPRACQTCAGELGEQTPALVIFEQPDRVEASLHHPQCCPPQWTQLRQPFRPIAPSWMAGLIPVPLEFGPVNRAPTVFLNPSYERAHIAAEQQIWRTTTLDDWIDSGFSRPDPQGGIILGHSSRIRAWYRDGTLTADLDGRPWRITDLAGQHPDTAELVSSSGQLLVAVTTSIDPSAHADSQSLSSPLQRAISDGDIAFAVITVSTDLPPPELIDAFTTDEFDGVFTGPVDAPNVIPFQPWEGLSYDRETGKYSAGMSMDGPRYNRLNVPGEGVVSGIIVGPPDSGKTNAARVIIVEAAGSGIFIPIVADPHGSNGYADVFGSWGPEHFTDTIEGTRRHLASVASLVADRSKHPENFTDPSESTPGVVMLIEDADTVFTDPELAELGARIVASGKRVGVGLYITARSLDLDKFSGRADLIVGLGHENLTAFSERALAQFQVLRSRT